MNSIPEIIQKIGGTGALANIIGVKLSTASEMSRRGTIPVKYWPRLIVGCKFKKIRGVTNDKLVALHCLELGDQR